MKVNESRPVLEVELGPSIWSYQDVYDRDPEALHTFLCFVHGVEPFHYGARATEPVSHPSPRSHPWDSHERSCYGHSVKGWVLVDGRPSADVRGHGSRAL